MSIETSITKTEKIDPTSKEMKIALGEVSLASTIPRPTASELETKVREELASHRNDAHEAMRRKFIAGLKTPKNN